MRKSERESMRENSSPKLCVCAGSHTSEREGMKDSPPGHEEALYWSEPMSEGRGFRDTHKKVSAHSRTLERSITPTEEGGEAGSLFN